MFQLNHTPGRTAMIDGKEHLFFSGYSYLGMGYIPEFAELVKEGMDRYGWLFPSSRISNTQLDLFEQFEAKLSEITGTDNSVCFSSGFLAGRCVMGALQQSHSYFFSPPDTHPAIDLLNNLSAQSFETWTEKVVAHINALKTASPVVISLDAVNPLAASVNDLSFLDHLNKPTICIVDDSHRAGLLSGSAGYSNEKVHLVLTYSLGKAFCLPGGAVSSTGSLTSILRNTPHYTASTSISPAFAYAFLEGQQLYTKQRQKLANNIDLFRDLTKDRFVSHPALPIFVLPRNFDTGKLEVNAIIVSSFAYPDPEGVKVNRIVLNALHTEDDLQRLADILL
ncbi:MAG: pyridoxal phosphate-dependent aminotransferase family protein [Chitinophagaceae bacterium]|jgi:7-keto-8-aminopelargonate synthetase-like enzyme|nr:pyridoxal phosphate-dependent aminotransferase family protein [Chitinophagaceae bacterium]